MFSKELQNLISPAFNDEVLLSILRKESGYEKVKIKSVKLRDSATQKGDSYLSSVVRFSVSGIALDSKNKVIQCHVIVKTLPKNIARRITFRSEVFFRNEVAFYNDVWSVLLNFQKDKHLKKPFIDLPICYSALADGKNDFVALEDLSCKHFTPFRRQGEINYETIILIIRLFAKFHALSFAYKDQYPEEFKKMAACLEETYFHEKYRTWYVDFHNKLIGIARNAVELELPPEYLKMFEATIGNKFFEKLCYLASKTDARFSLITQGDAWIPNFLCKYDLHNLPAEIRLIDFQLSRCLSPASDLTFFLYSSTNYTLLENRWEDIMMEYHKEFTDFLTNLGSSPSIFTYEDFKQDMKNNALYGLGMAFEALPFQMMEDSETADLDAIEGNVAVPIVTVWNVHPIKNQAGRQRLANAFKHAVDRGFVSHHWDI